MKMDQITFSQRYNNNGDQECKEGFSPHKEGNAYLIERKAILSAHKWNNGVHLLLVISEQYCIGHSGICSRELGNQAVYDHTARECPGVIPSETQVLLMSALLDGDLRGRYADTIAHRLFIDLFVMDKGEHSIMRRYLPEVCELWDKHYEKCG